VRLPEDVQNVMEVTGADAEAAENALALVGRDVQRAIGRLMGF
jgi:NACalpha-BTF3-like transcription factor